jgi:hypothetical protein
MSTVACGLQGLGTVGWASLDLAQQGKGPGHLSLSTGGLLVPGVWKMPPGTPR